jgi:hypothetical protein
MMLREHAPVSRLTAAANLHRGTLHDIFRSQRPAEGAIIDYLGASDHRLQQKVQDLQQTTFHATNNLQKQRLCLDWKGFLNL